MGRLHNREDWEQQLPRAVVAALEEWLEEQVFDLRHRGWFTEGRSDDPVARAMRIYPGGDTEQRILKFFTEEGVKKVQNIRSAWGCSMDFREHLAEPQEVAWLEDQRGIFMHVAGGGLASARPLTSLLGDPEFPRHCATIVGSIVAQWNEGTTPTIKRKVADVLIDMMGRRLASAKRWAEESGIDVEDAPDAVSRSGWPPAPVNPFTLMAGEEGERTVEYLIVGKAHGDLSGRNVLVPTVPEVAAGSYILIDYDRFSNQAPLARDSMHLLVALALDGFDRLGPESRVDLARVLVDPNTRDASRYVEPARALSAAIRTAAAPKPEKGLGDEWTQQCLLSLVGAGLVHLGRRLYTADPAAAKEWGFHLAALAAQAYLLQARPSQERVLTVSTPSPSTGGNDGGQWRLADRRREGQNLRRRLTSGPWGVVVLRGTRGVGKTALVDAVLNDLSKESVSGTSPRIHRYDVNAIARLDTQTLIDYVEGKAAPPRPHQHGGSSLVRLESALRRLGEFRVVVSVDSAENLLDPVTKQLGDHDLDEALELLATEFGHRVTVLLVTQDELASPAKGTWPTAEEPIVLPKLAETDFFAYLALLDRNGSLALASLTAEQRRVLHNRLQGNPRLAELVYAVVVVAESGLNLRRLTDNLREQEPKDVPTYLARLLVDGLSPLRRRVLEALAAFDTPVPETAVVGLLKEENSPEKVGQALSVLTSHRIVYSAEPAQYFLPRQDGLLVLNQMPDENARTKLYFSAATQLTPLQNSAPRGIDDLRVHFAELRALLRAREHPSAYNMICEIDIEVLRKWNSSHLLLEQRQEVRGKLADDYDEMCNENALGGIYVSRGQIPEADIAYGKALKIARERDDNARLMKIHANLAAMYWEHSDTELALSYFEYARDEAAQADDLMVQMGALEGIANCQRRRGHYDEAIQHAQNALAMPRQPHYPDSVEAQSYATSRDVTIALKLARWYGELGRTDDAARYINLVRAATENSDDGWLQASYLDGLADMLFDRGDPRRLRQPSRRR